MGLIKFIKKYILCQFLVIIEILNFNVMMGLTCFAHKSIPSIYLFFSIMFYCILGALKITLYMQLLINEGKSTTDLFPIIVSEIRRNSESHINPYIIESLIVNYTKKYQICNACNSYKPPRAHHCSYCNKCYLKYDHHSVFFNTCIGFHNFKYYLQFCVLLLVSTLNTMVFILVGVICGDKIELFSIVEITTVILDVVTLIIISMFLFNYYYLVSRNETIVECFAINKYLKNDHSLIRIFQEGPIKSFSTSKDRAFLNPYNLGYSKNWKEVFGDSISSYFSFSFTSKGDGYNWKTNINDQE